MNAQDIFEQNIESLSPNPEKREAFKKITFKNDLAIFEIKEGRVYFTEQGVGYNESSNDVIVNKIKVFLKKYPKVFSLIFRLVGLSFVGKGPKDAIGALPRGSVVVNLGSGATAIRPDVVNIDFYPFKNVDFVGDVANLPFADDSIDAIVCEHVLEHVPDPETIVTEMHRVLRPGGIVYIVIPFVMSFHSSPYDYYRWSKMGLERQFHRFEKVDSGIRSGPGAALDYILAEYFSTILSFGWKKLQQALFMAFLVLFAPLCYLDYLIWRLPTAENIAQHFYYIGRK